MTVSSVWTHLPAARDAANSGRYGVVLRLARTAAGLTLRQAGTLAGYSAASLSRMETGQQALSDVTVLRRLAEAFAIPPELFGLAPSLGAPVTTARPAMVRVAATADREGEAAMRRRSVLAGLLSAPLLATAGRNPASVFTPGPGTDPATALLARLEDLLLGRPGPDDRGQASLAVLRARLALVKADFQASRYQALAARLPAFVRLAESAASTNTAAAGILAESYNTVTHALIKLKAPDLGWIAADRAKAAAHTAGDPAITANVIRNAATLCRGTGRYARAEQLALAAADQLDPASGDPRHLSLYGLLLCNASYTAAQAGDRSRATELLDDAERAAARLGGDHNAHWTAFGPTNVTLHRVSAAFALGDAGTAIEHARTVTPDALRIPERQARYWIDVARAYDQWGRPAQCYRALTVAERLAPEEVHARPVVRTLTSNLLAGPQQAGMPGLRELATRVGGAA